MPISHYPPPASPAGEGPPRNPEREAPGPTASGPPPPTPPEGPSGRSPRLDWRRIVIQAAVAALIAGTIYLIIGSIDGGLSILGVIRVMGITAGLALVIGTVMTAIGTRMRGRHGAD
jgi:hypothetical protein